MFPAFVLASPRMATPWTLRWFIRRYTWLDGTRYCSYTAFMAHNRGGRSHRLFWLDQFDNSVQLRLSLITRSRPQRRINIYYSRYTWPMRILKVLFCVLIWRTNENYIRVLFLRIHFSFIMNLIVRGKFIGSINLVAWETKCKPKQILFTRRKKCGRWVRPVAGFSLSLTPSFLRTSDARANWIVILG